jgi:hypothetical protein
VLVLDDYRREGIATHLIEACRQQWPDIQWSGVTEGGEALQDAFSRMTPERKAQVRRPVEQWKA